MAWDHTICVLVSLKFPSVNRLHGKRGPGTRCCHGKFVVFVEVSTSGDHVIHSIQSGLDSEVEAGVPVNVLCRRYG